LLSFLAYERVDRLDRSAALISVAEVAPFRVVVDVPGIEAVLRGLDAAVGGLAHLHPEELVEDGVVEALGGVVNGRGDS